MLANLVNGLAAFNSSKDGDTRFALGDAVSRANDLRSEVRRNTYAVEASGSTTNSVSCDNMLDWLIVIQGRELPSEWHPYSFVYARVLPVATRPPCIGRAANNSSVDFLCITSRRSIILYDT